MYCPNCGAELPDGSKFCNQCGENLTEEPGGTTVNGEVYEDPNPPVVEPDSKTGEGLAVAGIVLGIIGVICWLLGFFTFGITALIAIVLGIVGLILASRAKKAGYTDTMQTVGFVLSLISLLGGVLVLVCCAACMGSLTMIGISNARSFY